MSQSLYHTAACAGRSLAAGVAVLALLAACEPPDPAAARSRPLAQSAADGGGCGDVTEVGCCADQTLRYCSGGSLVVTPCGSGALCGWSQVFGLYLCGASDEPDPTGQAPRACPATDGGPAPLDAAPVGDAAAADAVAADAAAADAAAADAADGGAECGRLTLVGCCEGPVLAYCSEGVVLSLHCGSSSECGWNAAQGFYDCNTSGASDPSGLNPRPCSALSGDGGVLADAGPDQALEAGARDLGADGGGGLDAGGDAALPADGEPAVDLPPALDKNAESPVDGAADLNGLDAPGLDTPGLDPGADQPLPVAGGGGCEGCVTGSSPEAGGLPLLLVAVLLVLRRRGNRGMIA